MGWAKFFKGIFILTLIFGMVNPCFAPPPGYQGKSQQLGANRLRSTVTPSPTIGNVRGLMSGENKNPPPLRTAAPFLTSLDGSFPSKRARQLPPPPVVEEVQPKFATQEQFERAFEPRTAISSTPLQNSVPEPLNENDDAKVRKSAQNILAEQLAAFRANSARAKKPSIITAPKQTESNRKILPKIEVTPPTPRDGFNDIPKEFDGFGQSEGFLKVDEDPVIGLGRRGSILSDTDLQNFRARESVLGTKADIADLQRKTTQANYDDQINAKKEKMKVATDFDERQILQKSIEIDQANKEYANLYGQYNDETKLRIESGLPVDPEKVQEIELLMTEQSKKLDSLNTQLNGLNKRAQENKQRKLESVMNFNRMAIGSLEQGPYTESERENAQKLINQSPVFANTLTEKRFGIQLP